MEGRILSAFLQFVHYATLPAGQALLCVAVFIAAERKRGKAMMLSLSAASVLNILLKVLFRVPRPWLMDVTSAHFPAEGGYAFPCLHAQVTAAVLCTAALTSGKRLSRFLCAAGICITAAVRVMSGVQSLADVSAGIAAGILCAVLVCRFRYYGNRTAGMLTGGITILIGIAAALFFDDPWGPGAALSVLILDLAEPVFLKSDKGRTAFGKCYGMILGIGVYSGLYIFLPFLIEWLVTPFWPGQVLIVFLIMLLPCLLPLFPFF